MGVVVLFIFLLLSWILHVRRALPLRVELCSS